MNSSAAVARQHFAENGGNVSSDDQSFNVYGLILTEGPPQLTSCSGWPTSTGWISATPAIPVYSTQTVNFQNSEPSGTDCFSYDSSEGTENFCYSAQGGAWALLPLSAKNPAQFFLELSDFYPVALTLTIHCNCYQLPANSSAGELFVQVNGQFIFAVQVGTSWADVSVTIPAGCFNAAMGEPNNIEIFAHDGAYNIVSVSVENDTKLQANYKWYTQFSGTLNPGQSTTFSQSVTTGLTSTTSETQTFAKKLGMSVSSGVSLDGLSASMSNSFSMSKSQSDTVSISISQESTQAYDYSQQNTTQNELAYAFWWLQIQFILPDSNVGIVIDAPPQAPVLSTFYPPEASSCVPAVMEKQK